ncbi:MAG: putative signal transducing protein [Solirubrobacteraceae bacterium]
MCGLPLVHAGRDGRLEQDPLDADERRRTARKVDPRYAEGEPVKAVGARNQAEAEFIQSLLLEEGIPSMVRRARGFDVPDFLAAGPREVLVPQAGAVAAAEVLRQSELLDRPATGDVPVASNWRLLLGVLGAFALVALVIALRMLL